MFNYIGPYKKTCHQTLYAMLKMWTRPAAYMWKCDEDSDGDDDEKPSQGWYVYKCQDYDTVCRSY